ncbi:MAG: hypothetical protein JNK82_22085 [Myxococcaceae bacterium]|nr:hypothetical protein [Myxococcaceae bacterium]
MKIGSVVSNLVEQVQSKLEPIVTKPALENVKPPTDGFVPPPRASAPTPLPQLSGSELNAAMPFDPLTAEKGSTLRRLLSGGSLESERLTQLGQNLLGQPSDAGTQSGIENALDTLAGLGEKLSNSFENPLTKGEAGRLEAAADHLKAADREGTADEANRIAAEAIRTRDQHLVLPLPTVADAKAKLDKVENPKVVKDLVESENFKKLDARTQAQVLQTATNYPGSAPYLKDFIGSDNFRNPNVDGVKVTGSQAEVARGRLLHIAGSMGESIRRYDTERHESGRLTGYEAPMSDTEAALRNSLRRMSKDEVKMKLIFDTKGPHGQADDTTTPPTMEYNLGQAQFAAITDPLLPRSPNPLGIENLTLHEINHLSNGDAPVGPNAKYFFNEFQAFRTGLRARQNGADLDPQQRMELAKKIKANYDGQFGEMDLSTPTGERLIDKRNLDLKNYEDMTPAEQKRYDRYEEEAKIRKTLAGLYGVDEIDIKSDGTTDKKLGKAPGIDSVLQDNGFPHNNVNDPNDLDLGLPRKAPPPPPPLPVRE